MSHGPSEQHPGTAGPSSSSSPRGMAAFEELTYIDSILRELNEEIASGSTSAEGTAARSRLADLRPSDRLLRTAGLVLFQCAAAGDTALLSQVLDSGVPADVTDDEHKTALHYAAANGRLAVAELLIRRGARCSVKNAEGLTPEDVADSTGHTQVAQLLRRQNQPSPSARSEDNASEDRSLKDSFTDEAVSLTMNQLASTSYTTVANAATAAGLHSTTATALISTSGQSSAASGRSPASRQTAPLPHLTARLGATGSSSSPAVRSLLFSEFNGLVLVLVGLPARGKSYVCKKILRFFNWSCVPTMRVTVSVRKLALTGTDEAAALIPSTLQDQLESAALRVSSFIREEKGIAIIDGTNTTRDRRANTIEKLMERGVRESQIMFVEIIHNDQEVIAKNIESSGTDPAVYRAAIAHHERFYEPMSLSLEPERHFIQLRDGRDFLLHRVQGAVPSRLVYMLQNLRYKQHTMYLTFCGESQADAAGLLGVDKELSSSGEAFSRRLAAFLQRMHGGSPIGGSLNGLAVLRSMDRRGAATVEPLRALGAHVRPLATLNDVSYGECEGDLAANLRAQLNDYTFVWPAGESVKQVYESRLEPVIHDLNAASLPSLVVAPRVIIAGLLLYFSDTTFTTPAEALKLDLGRHHIARIKGDGRVEVFDLSSDAAAELAESRPLGRFPTPTPGGGASPAPAASILTVEPTSPTILS